MELNRNRQCATEPQAGRNQEAAGKPRSQGQKADSFTGTETKDQRQIGSIPECCDRRAVA